MTSMWTWQRLSSYKRAPFVCAFSPLIGCTLSLGTHSLISVKLHCKFDSHRAFPLKIKECEAKLFHWPKYRTTSDCTMCCYAAFHLPGRQISELGMTSHSGNHVLVQQVGKPRFRKLGEVCVFFCFFL